MRDAHAPLRRAARRRSPRCCTGVRPGRQLVDHRDVEVRVGGHGERARNGGRGHDQLMRDEAVFAPFSLQRQALMHAEAMLLVDDRERERGELDAFLEQRVRADHDGRASPAAMVASALRRVCPGCGPDEQRHRLTPGLEPASKIPRSAARRGVPWAPSARPAGRASQRARPPRGRDHVLPQPTSPCTRRSMGIALQVRSISPSTAPGRASSRNGSAATKPALERAVVRERPAGILLNARLRSSLQRELMRQQLLEGEAPLRRMAPASEHRDRRVARRAVHVRAAPRGSARQSRAPARTARPAASPQRRALAVCVERRRHQLPQAPLGTPSVRGIDGRQMSPRRPLRPR